MTICIKVKPLVQFNGAWQEGLGTLNVPERQRRLGAGAAACGTQAGAAQWECCVLSREAGVETAEPQPQSLKQHVGFLMEHFYFAVHLRPHLQSQIPLKVGNSGNLASSLRHRRALLKTPLQLGL